jgi:polar amino acid transport system substrate-binding protein
MKAKALSMCITILIISTVLLSNGVRVGAFGDGSSFSCVECGELVGFNVDLILDIAHLAELRATLSEMNPDALIPALVTGYLDVVISNTRVTEELKSVLDFTDPFWSADQSIMVREDSSETTCVLYGKGSIGVLLGSTGDSWSTLNLKRAGLLEGQLVRYASYSLAVNALIGGSVDAILIDLTVAQALSTRQPIKSVGVIETGEYPAIAVRKGNEQLVDILNKALKELSETKRIDISASETGGILSSHFHTWS